MYKVKILLVTILLQVVSAVAYCDGVDKLSKRVTDSLTEFFRNRQNTNATVVRFENRSTLEGIGAMRFYQLMVSDIEAGKTFNFKDTLKGFNGKDGEFRNSTDTQFHIWIRLTSPPGKLGVGVVIFSKLTDRIELLKYFEENLNREELSILQIEKFGFERSGFGKAFTVNFNEKILDAASINYGGGEFLFVLKKKYVEIWTNVASNLKRSHRTIINYSFPEVPAIEEEGVITVFPAGNRMIVYAGTNFSRDVYVWSFDGQDMMSMGKSGFIPLKSCNIDNRNMAVGIKYDAGFNWFINELYLSPFENGIVDNKSIYKKKVPEFYSMACAQSGNEFHGVHLVDRDYNLRHFDANFQEIEGENAKAGGSLDLVADTWLVTSSYSDGTDKLSFYDIGKYNREVYSNRFDRSIKGIRSGIWKGKNGVWVRVENGDKSKLEFWSKTNAGN